MEWLNRRLDGRWNAETLLLWVYDLPTLGDRREYGLRLAAFFSLCENRFPGGEVAVPPYLLCGVRPPMVGSVPEGNFTLLGYAVLPGGQDVVRLKILQIPILDSRLNLIMGL